MLAGLVVQFRLPAIVSKAVFGAYGVVNSVVSPVNSVMVTGTIQTVSRFTSQRPEQARLVQAAGLRMHLWIGLPVALAFIAAAPLVAWFFHDASKTGPLMLAGVIVAGYSFYAVFVGTANGQREFHKQAGLDITFATVRTIGMLGMATAGLGVMGVVAGWVTAVAAIVVVAATWVGLPRRGTSADAVSVRPLLGFFAGVAVYLILFNVIQFVDTWLLKRLVTEDVREHAAPMRTAMAAALPWLGSVIDYDPTPAVIADVQVAYYTAVQNLARISYQAIIAATFVIFPLVSRSTFEHNQENTRRYIQVTLRYSFIFATAIAVVMAANPRSLLELVYFADYAAVGAPALAILALGNVAFSVFAIGGTILNGAGLTRPAIATAVVTLIAATSGNLIAVPMATTGGQVLAVTAAVTGGAMLLGAVTCGVLLWRRLGAFLPWITVVRVAVAVVVAVGVGRLLPAHSAVMTLVEAAIVGVCFLLTLVITRELGRADLVAIAQVRSKRGE
jgi:stage V sporulation protein B